MSDYFFTIRNDGESMFRDRGSKFIGISRKVMSESEAEKEIGSIRRSYHDARHHCYAWIIGEDHSIVRSNDDGEPGHSAGDPILGQIRSRELTNTLVVVVRYFGGTKLGVPGLINAYKTAASDVLDKSGIKKCFQTRSFELEYSYDSTSSVMRLVSDFDAKILDQEFEGTCRMRFSVRRSRSGQVEKVLQEYSERSILLNYSRIS